MKFVAIIAVVLLGIAIFLVFGTNGDEVNMQAEDNMEIEGETPAADVTDEHDGMDMEGETPATNDEVGDGALPVEEDIADTTDTDATEHTFDIDGTNYDFSIEEIRVNQGDTVTINFTSTQGLHDWVVDEFDAATAAVGTGQTSSVTFVADQTGEFEYYCSVASHRQLGMVGTLIVE